MVVIFLGTRNRPEVSPTNKYYISKHRFYELKHFCLQYREWSSKCDICKESIHSSSLIQVNKDITVQDPIGDIFASIDELYAKMQMVKNACKMADEQLSSYIFEAVTRDRSFTYLQTVLEIPCSRSTFYDRYRKFYYILSNLRK